MKLIKQNKINALMVAALLISIPIFSQEKEAPKCELRHPFDEDFPEKLTICVISGVIKLVEWLDIHAPKPHEIDKESDKINDSKNKNS